MQFSFPDGSHYTYSYDIRGNLFISSDGKLHYVDISSEDELELVHILQYDNLSPNPADTAIYGSIIDQHNLKDKVVETLDSKEDEYEVFPEGKYFDYGELQNITTNFDPDIDQDDVFFHVIDTPILAPAKKCLSGVANYEIIVMDEDTKRVLFASKCPEYCGYRITIMTNGIIKLNIISSCVKKYRLDKNAERITIDRVA